MLCGRESTKRRGNVSGTVSIAPGGLRWSRDRVRDYRKQHRIRGPQADRRDDSMTMNQVMDYLDIGHNGVLGLVRRGAIKTNQITDFAPWRVSREQLDSDEVQHLVKVLKQKGRLPRGGYPKPQPELFDAEQGLTSEVNKGAL
ncbi:MAG: hypothetical protein ACI841_004839 [Planctomycetota bacterium]|jgi:hypothetical protein